MRAGDGDGDNELPREDVCESKVEIVTPYWASNSNGKVGKTSTTSTHINFTFH